MTALPTPAIVDRVSSLKPGGAAIEVHSVGLNTNPFAYARWLVEQDRKAGRSVENYLIELKDGDHLTLSVDEVLDRAAATGLRPM